MNKTVNVSAWLRGLGQVVAWMFVAVMAAAVVLENWHDQIFAASTKPATMVVAMDQAPQETAMPPLEPLNENEGEAQSLSYDPAIYWQAQKATTSFSQDDFESILRASQATGVDWQVLVALFYDESTCGRNLIGQAGEQGPFQFKLSTWETKGQDGDGDERNNLFSVADASLAAAHYLKELGYGPGREKTALAKYKGGTNKAWEYADRTLSKARKMGWS